MYSSRPMALLVFLTSSLFPLLLGAKTGMLKVAHGPMGARNTVFVVAFCSVFLILLISTSSQPCAKVSLSKLLKRSVQYLVLGALLGYAASLIAFGSLIFVSRFGDHPISFTFDASSISTVAVALVLNTYGWLVGGASSVLADLSRTLYFSTVIGRHPEQGK